MSQSWWEWAEMSGSELKMSESGWEWVGARFSKILSPI